MWSQGRNMFYSSPIPQAMVTTAGCFWQRQSISVRETVHLFNLITNYQGHGMDVKFRVLVNLLLADGQMLICFFVCLFVFLVKVPTLDIFESCSPVMTKFRQKPAITWLMITYIWKHYKNNFLLLLEVQLCIYIIVLFTKSYQSQN